VLPPFVAGCHPVLQGLGAVAGECVVRGSYVLQSMLQCCGVSEHVGVYCRVSQDGVKECVVRGSYVLQSMLQSVSGCCIVLRYVVG